MGSFKLSERNTSEDVHFSSLGGFLQLIAGQIFSKFNKYIQVGQLIENY